MTAFKRGTVFRHGRWLDDCPECGAVGTVLRHLDFPGATTDDLESVPCPTCDGRRRLPAICRVTAIRHGEVYYGFGADARKASFHATPEYLLANGAVIVAAAA